MLLFFTVFGQGTVFPFFFPYTALFLTLLLLVGVAPLAELPLIEKIWRAFSVSRPPADSFNYSPLNFFWYLFLITARLFPWKRFPFCFFLFWTFTRERFSTSGQLDPPLLWTFSIFFASAFFATHFPQRPSKMLVPPGALPRYPFLDFFFSLSVQPKLTSSCCFGLLKPRGCGEYVQLDWKCSPPPLQTGPSTAFFYTFFFVTKTLPRSRLKFLSVLASDRRSVVRCFFFDKTR